MSAVLISLIRSDMKSVQVIQQDFTLKLLFSLPEENLFSLVFTFSIHMNSQFILCTSFDMLVLMVFVEEPLR